LVGSTRTRCRSPGGLCRHREGRRPMRGPGPGEPPPRRGAAACVVRRPGSIHHRPRRPMPRTRPLRRRARPGLSRPVRPRPVGPETSMGCPLTPTLMATPPRARRTPELSAPIAMAAQRPGDANQNRMRAVVLLGWRERHQREPSARGRAHRRPSAPPSARCHHQLMRSERRWPIRRSHGLLPRIRHHQ